MRKKVEDYIIRFNDGMCLEQWRMEWDSNPRYTRMYAGFQDRFLKPLGHPSMYFYILKQALNQVIILC